MKMLNMPILFSFAALMVACFAGCSETVKVTGTAEETNEFAFNESSSSEVNSSSDIESSSSSNPASSGSPLGSSSSKDDAASSSSQLDNSSVGSSAVESSSSMALEISSSSLESSSAVEESSSSVAPPQGGKMSSSSFVDPNSLEYYIEELGLNINQVYEGVMATKSTEETDAVPEPGQAMATEFDGTWPHRFVKANIGALEYFFPSAAEEYADLIESIESGAAEDGCGLYMMNVYGDGKSMGYVLADVSENKVVVLDIATGECPKSVENKTFRFLFRYCGVIDASPEIEHVEVNANIPVEQCPDFGREREWVEKND